MQRELMSKLIKWKKKTKKKPLVIQGARQVGKTWLMKSFADNEYKESVYINFENNDEAKGIFEQNYDMDRILEGLELHINKRIEPGKTLIIFDEIQESPKALNSLKYFHEDKPDYHVICAGSFLGLALHEGVSYPVGKVETCDLYPLTFNEFLKACGYEKLESLIGAKDYEMMKNFKATYEDELRKYFYVGGMPEVVQEYIDTHDYDRVRGMQKQLISDFERDMSKHAPVDEIVNINLVWNSVPSQLAKENKKYIYKYLKTGARAADYEKAMMWLVGNGLLCKVFRVTAPKEPLKAYEDLKAFKLYHLDVGLLSCMSNVRKKALISDRELFSEFKGALTEQYVAQQLQAMGYEPFYWSSEKGSAEVDFLIESELGIIPIEAKAGINLKAKSLRTYQGKFKPQWAMRISLADHKITDNLIDIPLYAICNII